MEVFKTGRTTGETKGEVNGCVLQQWSTEDKRRTIEICVCGDKDDGSGFARRGDSGSLVVTEDTDSDELYGVGLLTGLSVKGLGIVSPLWAVLEDVERNLGRKIHFLTSGITDSPTSS